MRKIPFQVDIGGVIEILGRSLYSRRDTAIRELIQNAHDAVVRRRMQDLKYFGEIRIRQFPRQRKLTVTDDGIGLSLEEAEKFLGTLGIGLSRLIKQESSGNVDATGIIGQFGVGLFSSFLLADKIEVVSRKAGSKTAVHWIATPKAGIRIGTAAAKDVGTTVTLHLSEHAAEFAKGDALLEETIKHYADLLPVPIFVNAGKTRINAMNISWLESTPDTEVVAQDLERHFAETPLDVLLIRKESPQRVQGALYVSSARTPGFSGRPMVIATVRRMVISRRLDGLLPEWATFIRGALELPDCSPTTSREDLVRDGRFERVQAMVYDEILARLNELGNSDIARLQSILAWHRYTFAGAALDDERLREILRRHYVFPTSHGNKTFEQLASGGRDTLWFNTSRTQEQWTNGLFSRLDTTCIQAMRTFEGALLTAFAEDARKAGAEIEVRTADPSDTEFLHSILGVKDLYDLDDEWQARFAPFCAHACAGHYNDDVPVIAFLNDKVELKRDFDEIKDQGVIPAAFAGIINDHLGKDQQKHRVLFNLRHALVQDALGQSVEGPLAGVLRLLAGNALTQAGLPMRQAEQKTIAQDLAWIAEIVRKR